MTKLLIDESKKLLENGNYFLAKNKAQELISSEYNNIDLWEIISEAEVNLNENADFSHSRLIEIYLRNQQPLKAMDTLDKLIKVNPEFNLRYFYKGQISNIKGKFKDAAKFFEQGIKENKSPAYCYLGLGLIEHKVNNKEKAAIEYYSKSLEIEELAETYNELGLVYMNSRDVTQDFKKSEEFFQKAVSIGKNKTRSLLNLGNLMMKESKYIPALKAYLDFFYKDGQYHINPDHPTYAVFAPKIGRALDGLALTQPEKFSDIHKSITIHLMEHKKINLRNMYAAIKLSLSRETDSLVAKSYTTNFLKEFNKNKFTMANKDSTLMDGMITINPNERNLDLIHTNDFFNDKNIINYLSSPLIVNALANNTNLHHETEIILTSIRKALLKKIHKKEEFGINEEIIIKFLSSLSIQLFLNEYIWFESKEETNLLNELTNHLSNKIKKGENIYDYEILILASYKYLKNYKDLSSFLKINTDRKNLKKIIKQQITDSEKEFELSKEIKTISLIEDDVSQKVRKQYEENPYPRWEMEKEKTERKYIDLLRNSISPNKLPQSYLTQEIKIKNVLVAGCGTGHHPISIAIDDPDIKIDALDISLSSLSYGKRMGQLLNVNNINWLHGDILNLKEYNKKYDSIECSGVLHHMKSPKEGFDVLDSCLNESGLMKIAVYSRTFRNKLRPAKEFLRIKNISDNLSSIQYGRKLIHESHNREISYPKKIADFFSTSEFRDLLLHIQEHDFSMEELEDLYSEKYDLLGIVFNERNIYQAQNLYKKMFPEDKTMRNLRNWDTIEKKNDELFLTMYQILLKKR
tara:strand:- start:1673 stop:4090 length:2418 start_codon:yes stop_codon:yes gene_type:complete